MAELQAGRELDALIAEQVMGWRHIRDGFGRPPDDNPLSLLHDPVPAYSTDMAAAWDVIVAMSHKDWHYELGDTTDESCYAMFIAGGQWWQGDAEESYSATGDAMPLAICRAALRVLEATT